CPSLPMTVEILNKKLKKSLNNSNDDYFNEEDEEVTQQFLKADKLIKELTIIMQMHENIVYTFKLIDATRIVSKFEKF
ncbi:7641_t:CDS:1, partial [Gigaspora margarita]